VGLAARAQGTHVRGYDPNAERSRARLEVGALDEAAPDFARGAGADLVVVAVPVGRGADVSSRPLDAGAAWSPTSAR
jgi:prephenate dehydrogenase